MNLETVDQLVPSPINPLYYSAGPSTLETVKVKTASEAVSLGIQCRESKDYAGAQTYFDAALNEYDAQHLPTGIFEVLGHIVINNINQAQFDEGLEFGAKTDLINTAEGARSRMHGAITAIEAKTHKADTNRFAIAEVHAMDIKLAKVKLGLIQISSISEKLRFIDELSTSFNLIYGNLKGSQAHKAWARNKHARFMLELNEYDKAEKLIAQGYEDIRSGYREELADNAEKYMGEHKLRIWETGLILTEAELKFVQGDTYNAIRLARSCITLKIHDNRARKLYQTRYQQAVALLNEFAGNKAKA